MTSALVGGVDPGLDGAIAFIDPDARRVVAVFYMAALTTTKDRSTKREIEPALLLATLRQLGHPVREVFIERAQATPQMGRSGAFNYGDSYGIARCAVAAMGWPITRVSAQQWKKWLGVKAAKDDAIIRASQLFPLDTGFWTPHRGQLSKTQCEGNAEATLIAAFGARRLEGATDGKQSPRNTRAGPQPAAQDRLL